MLASDAALARCEVIRIRLVGQRVDDRGHWTEIDTSMFSLQSMRVGPVHLDCEQSCNVCVSISVRKNDSQSENVGGSCWHLGAVPVDSPCWPPALPYSRKESDELLTSDEDYFHFAIFWKASVVNNEGHVQEAVSSLTQLPPENRQQLWIDREVVKATLGNGECRVSQPSVYDSASLQLNLEAVFDDGEIRTFKIPNTLAVVSSF
ncbi:hypothetical protein ANCDUO_23107 [Ancylostoma duodenale]|uniref:Uncharacterized protein n=1 Tax=Ancylostoma duodenale TaxID=51022 RepID=A0A0C2FPR4_9BILA|nr:hypothetical protein ANCDUO_23107 [Ancylostoma duodenale]